MKKEDFQNPQQETGNAENKRDELGAQKNPVMHTDSSLQNNMTKQAGLGRDLMNLTDERGGYTGSGSEVRSDQNTCQPPGDSR